MRLAAVARGTISPRRATEPFGAARLASNQASARQTSRRGSSRSPCVEPWRAQPVHWPCPRRGAWSYCATDWPRVRIPGRPSRRSIWSCLTCNAPAHFLPGERPNLDQGGRRHIALDQFPGALTFPSGVSGDRRLTGDINARAQAEAMPSSAPSDCALACVQPVTTFGVPTEPSTAAMARRTAGRSAMRR